jgi:hypothetical protein
MTAAEDKIKPLPLPDLSATQIIKHCVAMDDNHSYYYPVGVEIIIELAVEKPSWQQSTAACRSVEEH